MSYQTRWFRILSGALILTLVLASAPLAGFSPHRAFAQTEPVFINEIHYDNTGTDAGEAIEIAGPAGTDLTGWSLVLYNGTGGVVYDTDPLSGTIPNLQNGFGVLFFTYAVNGIQNGPPDGLALVAPGNAVVQFLSYEGTFTAVGGPADGLLSEDIGVFENGSEPLGLSLQLTGTGSLDGDFTWTAPDTSTFGAVNTGQTFEPVVVGPAEPVINEFSASTTGTDVEYVEIFGTASQDYSTYTLLEIEGDSGAASGTVDEVIPLGLMDSNGLGLISLAANALENGTITLLLVENFTGALNADLDTNNDGVFEITPWSSIADAVAVNDGGAGDLTYGVPALGPNYDGLSSFAPGGASRIPDGFDSNAISDWVRNDFELAGIPGFAGTIILGEAYNTPGAPNQIFVPPPEACGDPFTPIYTVQGNADASPLAGTEVAVEGVVVGDFQNNASPDNGNLNGFHVQDATGDADPATSDGVFIYAPGGMDVAAGDAVRVRGPVSEFNGMTEITASQIWLCSTGSSIAATPLSLPVSSVGDFEAFEGMFVTFPQPLTISEYFNFDRFGEIVLTSQRHLTPTAQFEPGPDAIAAAQQFLLDRITLDDGRSTSNPDPAIHPNGNIFDLNNLFRGGDLVQNVTGVLDYGFNLYRIQPTLGADYFPVNVRPAQPDEVGGYTQVASFNVLNYFTTLTSAGPICGPNQDEACRGADTLEEFVRQRSKIVAAISQIDADVVGLLEIENHPADVPTADLVSGLNAVLGAGAYDYIATGAIGTDVIRTALIYKPGRVTPLGSFKVLDTSVDPRFLDDYNRPVLAQTFQDNYTGEIFTVAVNHLKSKGSDCNDVGDPDTGDGSGNCNLTRTAAAEALVDWLAADPTGSGDADFLIIGDLNSYDKEAPIDALVAGGYTDLVFQFLGEEAYSYVFDGQTGYLDHALASSDMVGHITGASIWHINADEADLIDYDMSFKLPAQDLLYAPDAYRSSDHDPVIVGICEATPPQLVVDLSQTLLWPPRHQYVTIQASLTASDNADADPTITLVYVTSNEPDEGLGDGDLPDDIVIIDDQTFRLRAERSGLGNDRVYTITYLVTDDCGNSQYVEAYVTIPHNR
ncbi:MAG TPA: ExeM/NucH family extracellular endonuclease [Anaerolineales bacterium]|nr:ExeM/NucH family extracellular endonuclease [Anaerolineales bacterium]